MTTTPCSKLGCSGVGTQQPRLIFRAPIRCEPCGPITADIGLTFCGRCAMATTAQTLLSDEGWTAIYAACARAGQMAPERSRTEIEWVDTRGPKAPGCGE